MAVAFNESKHHARNPVMTMWYLQLPAQQQEKWEATEGAKRELQGRREYEPVSCPPTHVTQG